MTDLRDVRAAAGRGGLRRRIGPGLLVLYGIGVMIGAGIYVLVGAVAGEAGLWAPLAFLLAGLVALPSALSYGELSARIPESAGEAAFVHAATGMRGLAWLTGLAIALIGIVSAAAILQGGVGYLAGLVALPEALLLALLLALLVGAALAGVLESLALAGLFTLIEVGGLVMVAGAGLAAPPAAGWADLPPLGTALPGLAGAALLAFFAYLGFEDMVNMAEETIAPERTMPRAILIALAVTALIYMLVALAAVRAVPVAQLAGSERPLALVMAAGWPAGVALLSAIAVVAALNGVLAQIVMAARVLYGLGARHGGPAVLARVDPRRGTPVVATLGVGALVLVLALAVPLEALAEATSALLLAVFMAVNGSLIALRRQPAPARGMFRGPSWAPWAGLVLSALTLGLGMV